MSSSESERSPRSEPQRIAAIQVSGLVVIVTIVAVADTELASPHSPQPASHHRSSARSTRHGRSLTPGTWAPLAPLTTSYAHAIITTYVQTKMGRGKSTAQVNAKLLVLERDVSGLGGGEGVVV